MDDIGQQINEALVYKLADQLLAQGKRPTNLGIREMNGNRGSMATIAPLLKKWREERRSLEGRSKLTVTPEIEAALMPLVWQIEKNLNVENADENMSLKEDIDQLVSELNEKQLVIESKENQIASLGTELENKEQLIDQLLSRAKEQEEKIAELEEVNRAADKDYQRQLRDLSDEILDSNTQLSKSKDQVANLQRDIQRLEAYQAKLSEQNDKYLAIIGDGYKQGPAASTILSEHGEEGRE